MADTADTLTFRVVSYNVENLFDTRHDSLKHDEEFLPQATRHWNNRRYRKKLDDLARTIIAIGGWNPPALVGLCEVENDNVMNDLTRRSALRQAGYRYVMTQSPDSRGIDVALMYQPKLFKPIDKQCLRLPNAAQLPPTRDILHVSGSLPNGDTLDVCVVHLPSRRGGAKASEQRRLPLARLLKRTADSLIARRERPQILIMGDFNDYPQSPSIRQTLQALAPEPGKGTDETRLYHLLARKTQEDRDFGSYKFREGWGLLDHLIVSGRLLKASAGLHTDESRAGVFRPSYLLMPDRTFGGTKPRRTYTGVRYAGGVSDHLPIWAEFTLIP